MFIVSTIRGFNLVFNDIKDLENQVNNLTKYLEICRDKSPDKVPVFGVYPDGVDVNNANLITRSLQEVFSGNKDGSPDDE